MRAQRLLSSAALGRGEPDMCHGYAGRRYYSREERRAWLEDYATQLENELKAVRERIQDLSSARA